MRAGPAADIRAGDDRSSATIAAIQPRAAARTGLLNPESVDEPRIAGYGVIATRAAAPS
jgi:hypothetical protein